MLYTIEDREKPTTDSFYEKLSRDSGLNNGASIGIKEFYEKQINADYSCLSFEDVFVRMPKTSDRTIIQC